MSVVLVVDDVKTDRELMGRVVSAAGHRAEYAESGDEAVKKAKTLKPALILLDVVMPGTDGFAACRALHKDPDTSSIPVVLVTQKATEADQFWGKKQGCADYVTKPFTPEQMTQVIRRFV
jgi:twitching motility two-component system response regulator PilH